jgi:hypothetical protein
MFLILIEPGFLNHFSSTKNAELHIVVPPKKLSLLIGLIVVLKASRSEGIVVWQQLMPLQLLPFITSLSLPGLQIDKHQATDN